MAFVKANRVQESSITIGTGNIVLGGIWDASFRTFASQMANGDTTQILILNTSSLGEWEIDEATYNSSSNELARTNVVSSSNANAAVTFTVGVKTVSMLPIASSMIVEDNDGNAAVTGNLTATKLALTSSGATDTLTITDAGASGANIQLTGSAGAKTIRVVGNAFTIRNNANTTPIFQLSDAGALNLGSTLIATRLTSTTYMVMGDQTTTTSASYAVLTTDWFLNCNRAGTTTLTLPNVASATGRIFWVKTLQAQTVISNALNVMTLTGGGPGTAILAATAGKWAMMQSDGSFWNIMTSG